MGSMRGVRRVGSAALVLSLGLGLAACTDEADTPPATGGPTTPASESSPPSEPASAPDLTFGVFGSPDEIAAYQEVVDAYNASTDTADITLQSWPDDPSLMAALNSGAPRRNPDVFMIKRDDLDQLMERELVQPVDSYLDARSVDLGDRYSREALEAFSGDHRLQCMPYGVSPQVVYYNTDLIDFDRMAARGLDVPTDPELDRWTIDDFAEAATFATHRRRGTRGLAVEPTLRGLAPFLFSAGGKLVDDEENPTSLAFSDGDTRSALEAVLPVLRNAAITLTPEQLAQASPLEWFQQGRLGMLVGDRSLTPVLRANRDLRWDVMPIPVVDSAATIGDYTGLCLSAATPDQERAADLLAALVSDELVSTVARTGYVVPVNTKVALSDDFLQVAKMPLNSKVFVSSVRNMRTLPLAGLWAELERAVSPTLHQLLAGGPTIDIEALTEQIDAESRTVLAPEEPTEEPTDGAAESPEE